MIYYPSITEVLGVYADFSMIREDVLLRATERGTAVHAACASYLQGFPSSLKPDWQGYFDSFQRWADSFVTDVLLVEEKIFHEKWIYSGTPDWVVKTKSWGVVVIDGKTPVQKQKAWKGQCAAQFELASYKNFDPQKCGSLRLDPEGKEPKMDWYESQAKDFAAFISALQAYRYFKL